MEKRELLLILNRVLELCEVMHDQLPMQSAFHPDIENDKYIREQGFTFDKLSEEINKLEG